MTVRARKAIDHFPQQGVRYSCCVIAALLLLSAGAANAVEEADLILHHGKVVTVDRDFSIGQALAIRDGKILKVGTDEDVLKTAGPRTEKIDLQGKLVLPGLIDSHVHPTGAAMHEFDHEIPDMEAIADVLAYIRKRAAELGEGKWISIRQVFITRLKEQRYPTKAELDEAAPKNPVVFSTGPDASVNSLALSLSGIDKDFKTTGIAKIEKDPATGEPTGILRSATGLLKTSSSGGRSATDAERDARLMELFHDYNSVGLTGIIDRNAGNSDLTRYQGLLASQKLDVRIAASAAVDAQARIDQVQQAIRDVAANPLCKGDSRLRIIGVKTFLDGGMLTGSARMRQPWGVSRIYSIDDPRYLGQLYIPLERLVPMVQTAVESGLQFTAHSVGDGAVHTLLAAYEEVNKTTPVAKTRPCITHSNFMSREAIEQAKALGVVVDIQPAWLYLDAHTLAAQFGYDRLRYFQPLKSLFEAGVIGGGGSDHMQKIGSLRSVNPYNPWLGMWVTITRKSKHYDRPMHPEEALSREQAIRYYTANNAYLMFLEDQVGSLEQGKLADFIIVDRDLLTCPVDDIKDTRVLATWLGGRKVFDATAK